MQTDCWEGIDFSKRRLSHESLPKENFLMKVFQTGAWRGNIQEERLPSQDWAWQVVFLICYLLLFNFFRQIVFFILICHVLIFWQVVFRGTWSGERSSSLASVEMMKMSTIIATTVNKVIIVRRKFGGK